MSLWLIATAGFGPTSQAAPDFHREVEPILIKRCSECHGSDQQKGKLRLDARADALKGGKSGKPAVVPGRSAESQLLIRVVSTDPDEQMPPKGERLSADQIQTIRQWIEAGAEWPDADHQSHWAFRPLTRPTPPTVRNSEWSRNEIDGFVLSRLEKEGLSPAVEADGSTLLRRLSLDLIGLPPTPAEVDAFLNDHEPGAYERCVDRLLASPHYGEHNARGWLDLARYADSNGYQVDSMRSMWPYRDWVISAFNANMPFDRFSLEQMAGDLLPNATLAQKVATGFHRNSKTNDEGGGDDEEYRTKAVKDRVSTTATTWLGLTMQCAECHSHKYDPITQEEYYRFYAFFNSTADRGNGTDPSVNVPPPETQSRARYLQSRRASVLAQLADAERGLPQEQAAWEAKLAGKPDPWTTLAIAKAVSTGGATFTNLPDQSILATGVNPIYDTYIVETETDQERLAAILLEVLPDSSLPHKGPGRWGQSGNFILDEMTVSAVAKAEASATPINLKFRWATADWQQRYYQAEHAVDRNPKTGWAIAPRFGQRHFLIAELQEPLTFRGGARLTFRFDFYHGNSHTIGRLRLSAAAEADPDILWPRPPEVASALAVEASRRSPEQVEKVSSCFRDYSPRRRQLERELFLLNEREADLANTRYASLVMKELEEPRPTQVQVRGNFLEKGALVTPGVPAFLPPLPANQPLNRLTLARWLFDPANPLTARVAANRLWERFFGTGIVKTSEDFGKQGEAPSHPELLDWLASRFIQSGWDIKALQRTIVLSAAYRQSSVTDAKKLEKDPYNRLLARGPRFRLDAELIRDQALAISGLLSRDLGGPSVFPPQVPNLWKEIGFLRPEIGMDEWPTSFGPDLYRRALYTFWRRVCTYPVFATFDAPSRDVCTARRPRTNTPLQALAGLNEPTLLEAARVFAQRILREGGTEVASRIAFAFKACVARPPTPEESSRLMRFLERQHASFRGDPAQAMKLLEIGEAERPTQLDPPELAAWTMVANVLLNLDETLTKG